MEREYRLEVYDMNGEVGYFLVSLWDGRGWTNMSGVTKRVHSTSATVPFTMVGDKVFDELTYGELRSLRDLFELNETLD